MPKPDLFVVITTSLSGACFGAALALLVLKKFG